MEPKAVNGYGGRFEAGRELRAVPKKPSYVRIPAQVQEQSC